MESIYQRRLPVVAVDVLLLVLCGLHVPALVNRAGVPFQIEQSGRHARVLRVLDPEAAHPLVVGSTLISVEGIPVGRPQVVELLADGRRVGDAMSAVVERDGGVVESSFTLVRFYRTEEIVLYCFIGLVTWLVGLFILLNGPPGRTTDVLHAAMMGMAGVVMLAWEGHSPGGLLPGTLVSALFFTCYALVAANFFHFTRLFPARLRPKRDIAIAVAYAIAGLAVAAATARYWIAHRERSLESILAYSRLFDAFHVVIVLIIFAGIASFVRQYRRARRGTDRKRLHWLLLGLLFGPTPFLFFTVLPGMLAPSLAAPEHITLLFLIIIPLSFAISFVRYHIMDVALVLNRTTVYAIAVGFILVVYAGVIAAVTAIVGQYVPWAAIAAAVLSALVFDPGRRVVQGFVDRRFFRIEYDFREAQRWIVDRIRNSPDVASLARVLVTETEALIPVRRLGFFALEQATGRLRCAAQHGFDALERRGVRFEREKLKAVLTDPVVLDDRVEPGVRHVSADSAMFSRWGIEIVFPAQLESGDFLGFLVLGRKTSDALFGPEDIDLLANVCSLAALELKRIMLQQDLLRKESEARHLAALNELKSDFVSYVSHEFNNPLAAIRMFAGLLRSPKYRMTGKKREFVEMIEGEAQRLERMVSTILDSAKIDSGAQVYRPEVLDLRAEVMASITTMAYQLKKHGFTVVTHLGRRGIPIRADRAALGQAVRNLISNAIKYSGQRKHLTVAVARRGDWCCCEVKDRGLGIPEEMLPHVFKKFHRGTQAGGKILGVGLGLPLVKHIMDSHGGRVEVASTPGAGSTFTLVFPVSGDDPGAEAAHTDR